jgi:hypothetical protein
LSLDQKLQLWNVIGTWVAGLATFAAVVVSLYLATQGQRVRLRCHVGIRITYPHVNKADAEFVVFDVTNVGDRSVTISQIGWMFGKRKNRVYCVQALGLRMGDNVPKRIEHGERAAFYVPLYGEAQWLNCFARDFLEKGEIETALETLRAQVFTSVGTVVEIRPELSLIDRLRAAAQQTEG